MSRNKYLTCASMIAIVMVACSSAEKRPGWNPALPKVPKSFRVSEVQERRFSTEFTLVARDRVLRIEAVPNLGPEGAQTMIEDGIMGVQALYANALSPYPGDISKEIVSDQRFQPQLVRTNLNGRAYQYILLFANERFGYGAMTADAVRYRSLLGWFYCERADIFYKVRCFLPLTANRQELESLFRSLACP